MLHNLYYNEGSADVRLDCRQFALNCSINKCVIVGHAIHYVQLDVNCLYSLWGVISYLLSFFLNFYLYMNKFAIRSFSDSQNIN